MISERVDMLCHFSVQRHMAVVYALLAVVASVFALPPSVTCVAVLLLAGAWRAARGSPPTLRGLRGPPATGSGGGGGGGGRRSARYKLRAMPVNHFGEKVRWALDRAGVAYEEADVGGLLSATLEARSVPSMEDRWTCSSIGNSDEILKYVAAVDGSLGPAARAVLASSAATADWEADLNALGHAVQGYAYYYVLDGSAGHRQFVLRAWGAYEPLVPLLDRALVWAGFPLLRLVVRRAFGLRSARERDARLGVITRVLDRVDAALARSEYLTGSSMSWVDMAFCALAAPLLYDKVMFVSGRPSPYARGRFSSFSLPAEEFEAFRRGYPAQLKALGQLIEARPAGRFVLRMYAARGDVVVE
jgi:glutathione S-transferase